jgi:hypothetical protein
MAKRQFLEGIRIGKIDFDKIKRNKNEMFVLNSIFFENSTNPQLN